MPIIQHHEIAHKAMFCPKPPDGQPVMRETGDCFVERRLTQALITGWQIDSIADEHEDLRTLFIILA